MCCRLASRAGWNWRPARCYAFPLPCGPSCWGAWVCRSRCTCAIATTCYSSSEGGAVVAGQRSDAHSLSRSGAACLVVALCCCGHAGLLVRLPHAAGHAASPKELKWALNQPGPPAAGLPSPRPVQPGAALLHRRAVRARGAPARQDGHIHPRSLPAGLHALFVHAVAGALGRRSCAVRAAGDIPESDASCPPCAM